MDWHDEEQQKLRDSEPEEYEYMRHPKLRGHEFGDKLYSIGFATNLGAGGYHEPDPPLILLDDTETRSECLIEYCIHEGLHAIWPHLSEGEVERAGRQLASFVASVLKIKVGPLPKIPPFAKTPTREAGKQ